MLDKIKFMVYRINRLHRRKPTYWSVLMNKSLLFLLSLVVLIALASAEDYNGNFGPVSVDFQARHAEHVANPASVKFYSETYGIIFDCYNITASNSTVGYDFRIKTAEPEETSFNMTKVNLTFDLLDSLSAENFSNIKTETNKIGNKKTAFATASSIWGENMTAAEFVNNGIEVEMISNSQEELFEAVSGFSTKPFQAS